MAEHDPFAPVELTAAEAQALAASDLRAALGWIVFGAAVLIGSLTMDRLESQGINPYTVPGLLPGLLGVVTILLGAMLAVRSWRRGGTLRHGGPALDRAEVRRLAIVLALILIYAVVLVGHGMPFWLASAVYVSASILALQQPRRSGGALRASVREIAFALAAGIASGAIITYVFQDLFLVRLP
jgi:hypothetical protein